MKNNIGQQKEKKSQIYIPQKSSYIFSNNKNDSNLNTVLYNGSNASTHQRRNAQQVRLTNNKIRNNQEANKSNQIYQNQSYPKQFSKRQNYISTQNLVSSPKNLQAKSIRQSQNPLNNEKNKTPPNSICQKRLNTVRSATHLSRIQNDELILRIKPDNSAASEFYDEDTEQSRLLMAQIKEAEQQNEKIQEQIRQLKFQKLFLNSQPRQIMHLKSQIQTYQMKINQIKQSQKRQKTAIQSSFNQYYSGQRKAYCQAIDRNPNQGNYRMQKLSEPQTNLSRTSSNLGYNNPTYATLTSNSNTSSTSNLAFMGNPYADIGLPAGNSYTDKGLLYNSTLSSPLAKSKYEAQAKMKKSSNCNEEKQLVYQNSSNKLTENKASNQPHKVYIRR